MSQSSSEALAAKLRPKTNKKPIQRMGLNSQWSGVVLGFVILKIGFPTNDQEAYPIVIAYANTVLLLATLTRTGPRCELRSCASFSEPCYAIKEHSCSSISTLSAQMRSSYNLLATRNYARSIYCA